MSTHNLCFRAKIRKKKTFFLYKSGVQRVYFSWTCFPDVSIKCIFSIMFIMVSAIPLVVTHV